MAPVIDKAIVPVILSGGSGQRLWPLSRELYPKQLINLISEHSNSGGVGVRFRDRGK